ncbi:Acyl-peptide hydrolase [Aphelenchoides bicaudatus]|nr:Acyl-peptide hydrolase [Aphelenchoides bicaudatus]
MGSKLNKAGAQLCLDAAFVTSGKFKGFADLQVAKDGTIFAVKVQSSDGFRALLKREQSDLEWSPIETKAGVKNAVNEYGGTGLYAFTKSNFAYTSGPTIFWNQNGAIAEFSRPDCHFADLNFHDQHLYCVVEDRSKNSQSIGRFDFKQPDSFDVVAKGYDFYSTPRISPDGKQLLYVAWNDPNMPWDATQIHLVDLAAGKDTKLLPTNANASTNYQSLQWKTNSESFYFISDENNFWSLYEYCLKSNNHKLVASISNGDLAEAVWNIGDDRFYSFNSNVIIYRDDKQLYAKFLDTGKEHKIGSADFTQYSRLFVTESNTVYCIASGPLESEALLEIHVKEDGSSESAGIEAPESIVFNVVGANGEKIPIEGFYYTPLNASSDQKAPLIMLAHAGPTTRTSISLDKKKLFYRSHGFALFDINYRGSTGYGRAFRDHLYNNWGDIDIIDVCEGAKHLIDKGRADKNNVFIVGSSASGYGVLRALYKEPHLFKAAVCSYGFSDLLGLATETHRFEKAYNYHLIAPESDQKVWQERTMVDKLDKIQTPLLLYHGKDDPVVPYQQSVQIHDQLKKKGIKTDLVLFDGEGHGFRKAENVNAVLEGTLSFFKESMASGDPSSHI